MVTETVEPPPIPGRFRKTRTVEWWGYKSEVTPAIVDAYLGNGRRLLRFQPLNTRPDYYLIRIDSKWDCGGDKFIDEHLDDIIEAIINQYSEMEREREYIEENLREQGIEVTGDNTDLDGNEDRRAWQLKRSELPFENPVIQNQRALFDVSCEGELNTIKETK
jgi:hypothetical protein